MSWYRTGTVTVTTGSKNVTGVGTLWASAVNVGDAFALVDANGNPTGAWYEVETVTSNTALVLKQTYTGTPAPGSNKQYAVFNLVGNMTTPSFAQRLAQFFDSFQGLIDKPTTTPTASSIPIADGSGKLAAGWLPAATTSAAGVVELATSAEMQWPLASTTQSGTLAVTPAGVKAVLQQAIYSPVTIYARDSLRAAVEAGTGGKQTVMYDDLGQPSYMVNIPAFTLGTIDPLLGATTNLHPAFTQNGVKRELWIGAYPARVYNGRACSVPGVDPTGSLTFDAAKTACTAKGAGWHLLNNWEWAAIALWCLKNEFQPRGNTNWGRSHEATYETGARGDNGTPGTATGTGRTQTGSGPASWRHDGTFSGLADLVGNVWEWTDGLKLIDGKIHMPVDNRPDLAEASWPDTGFAFDSTVAGAGAPVLSNAVTNTVSDPNTCSVAWPSMTKKAGLTVAASLAAAALAPITHFDTGAYDAGNAPNGTIYIRNEGERMPLRGGSWSGAAVTGLFYLNCINVRSRVDTGVGFRPAFLV